MRSPRVAVAIGAAGARGGRRCDPGRGHPIAPAVHVHSSKRKVKTITVADDYFSLARLTVKKGQKIKWMWSKQNYDSHNVTLVSGPKGISNRKFTSATGVFGIKFERTFLKPGKYHFRCTIHPDSMNNDFDGQEVAQRSPARYLVAIA